MLLNIFDVDASLGAFVVRFTAGALSKFVAS
jgi:hypothetical protein